MFLSDSESEQTSYEKNTTISKNVYKQILLNSVRLRDKMERNFQICCWDPEKCATFFTEE